MERVARGLFFHDFGRRWLCALALFADGALMADLSPSPSRQIIRRLDPLLAMQHGRVRTQQCSGTSGSLVLKETVATCYRCASTVTQILRGTQGFERGRGHRSTTACKRRPTASARASLPLPGAPEAQRYRAKISLASLAGCKSLPGKG